MSILASIIIEIYLNMCPFKRNAQTTQKRTKINITMKTISKRRCLERGRALLGPLLPSGRRTRKRKGLQFRVLQFDSKLAFGAAHVRSVLEEEIKSK